MGKVIYSLVLVCLFIIAGLVAISAVNIPGNYRLLTVLSGSMEPKIKTGSIVVVSPMPVYQKGEVITFSDPTHPKTPTTHRIEEVKDDNGKITFITKGDANKTVDMGEVSQDRVLGKVIFALPYLGYPASFAKTQEGLLILVIIPAVIIIYSELINIKNESIRLVAERRNRKLTLKEEIEEKIGEEIIAVEKGIKK